MVPLPKLKIDVTAEHSCNWRCCFNLSCPSRGDIPVPQEPQAPSPSPVALGERAVSDITGVSDSSERIEVIVHRHHHRPKVQKVIG